MKLENVLDLAQEVKGMPVVMLQRWQQMGRVVDTIVHPTEGFVMGFVLVSTTGQERWLMANDCFIHREARVVFVTPDAWHDLSPMHAALAAGVRACKTLLNVSVITNHGQSLGQVVAIYATEGELRTIYRVATSRLRFFVRGGVFLPGDLPLAWLEKGTRLIVPADAMQRDSFSSLENALRFI